MLLPAITSTSPSLSRSARATAPVCDEGQGAGPKALGVPSCSNATSPELAGDPIVTISTSPSLSMSPSAGVTPRITDWGIMKCRVPVSPSSTTMLPGPVSPALPITVTTSGTSQRSMLPSPLSSVRLATSGVT